MNYFVTLQMEEWSETHVRQEKVTKASVTPDVCRANY